MTDDDAEEVKEDFRLCIGPFQGEGVLGARWSQYGEDHVDFISMSYAAVAAGQPALLNCALGLALVLSGTPIYFYYRWRKPQM